MNFICLFFPALILNYILDSKEKFNFLNFIIHYGIYNILVNSIMLFIINYIKENSYLILNSDAFTVSFSLKYMLLASVIALFLGLFIKYIRKNFNVTIKKK